MAVMTAIMTPLMTAMMTVWLTAVMTGWAQVVIPYGNFDNGFEKYLVAGVALAALLFAMWRYFRRPR